MPDAGGQELIRDVCQVSMAATKAEDGIERCGSRLLIKGEFGGRQQLSPLFGQMLVSRMLELFVRQAEREVKRSGVVAGGRWSRGLTDHGGRRGAPTSAGIDRRWLAVVLEGRNALEQLAKQGVTAERVATRRVTTEGDGARHWRWTDWAREGSAVPESPAADTVVPTEADTRYHIACASGTKGADVVRSAVAEGRGTQRRLSQSSGTTKFCTC